MEFLQKIQVIERLDQLIKLKSTGTADDLSRRLNISKRSVYNILELMKRMGAPIKYNQTRQTYYYSYECNFVLGFLESKKL
ncbi:HTH domain-containing protein [uncultured Tenacibaculum sp.]|uniref:HTH domain-containing protein n=1 Tax=uncultured Tenacibaculum sp. TaxID=174713 RepID=UPI00261D8836|nr:HTH domain-containing protein [uncultured Tenacibaculum sp.]